LVVVKQWAVRPTRDGSVVPEWSRHQQATERSIIMQITTIGIDLAKKRLCAI